MASAGHLGIDIVVTEIRNVRTLKKVYTLTNDKGVIINTVATLCGRHISDHVCPGECYSR